MLLIKKEIISRIEADTLSSRSFPPPPPQFYPGFNSGYNQKKILIKKKTGNSLSSSVFFEVSDDEYFMKKLDETPAGIAIATGKTDENMMSINHQLHRVRLLARRLPTGERSSGGGKCTLTLTYISVRISLILYMHFL